MMVDDAHASGVFGKNGRGTIDHFGVHGRVDVQVGTLSKAIGALGGYVAGNRHLIEFLYQRARPFLFSTSHPPAVAAACIAALDVLLDEPQIMERLWDNTRFFKEGLVRLGFDTGISESPITPVIAGDSAKASALSDRLFERRCLRPGDRVPDRAARQGTRPNHRDRDPHARRPAVRARRLRQESAGRSVSFEELSLGSRARTVRHLHAGRLTDDLQRLFTDDTRDAYDLLHARTRRRSIRRDAALEERAAAVAGVLRRLHAAAFTGTPALCTSAR